MEKYYVIYPDGSIETFEDENMGNVMERLHESGILKYSIFDEETYIEEFMST